MRETGDLRQRMILFVLPTHASMGSELALSLGIRLGQFSIERFPNQELHAVIQTHVANEECLILGTIAPPDEQLLSLLLLSHTLKKEGARSMHAFLPYLAYARDDKQKAGQSVATAWVGALLQASGVDEVITVDVHSLMAQRLFPMPLVSLSPADLFAQEMKRLRLLNATIVAPDEGARDRCQAVASAAGMANEYYEERWFSSSRECTVVSVHLADQDILFGTDLLFHAKNLSGCVMGIEICEDLWTVQPPSGNMALSGATVLLNPSASDEVLGKSDYRRALVQQQAARCLAAYLYAGAGPDESTTDVVWGDTLSSSKMGPSWPKRNVFTSRHRLRWQILMCNASSMNE